jgi:hypothetical protein
MCFNFNTVYFVQCLEITIKFINSYQCIISLSCCYMFRHLYSVLRELVCICLVTNRFVSIFGNFVTLN